jgi:hypothetical protein
LGALHLWIASLALAMTPAAQVITRANVNHAGLYGQGAARGRRINARLGCRPDHDTLSKVGKHFSESPRSPAEVEAYAGAMADMFCAYLESLAGAFGPPLS